MSWTLETLEGIISTAEGGVYNVISKETVEALLADKGALKLLAEHGYEITPLTNDAGEVIGNVIRTASSSNGATTAVSNTVNVLVKDVTVDQTMLDSIASGSIGTASDVGELAVGDTVSQVTMEAGGAGVGGTALATVAGPAIAVGLGVGVGVLMYNLAPDFWTNVSDKLVKAGKTIGGKVLTFFDKDGNSYYDKETIDIVRQALIDSGYLTKEGTTEQTIIEKPTNTSDDFSFMPDSLTTFTMAVSHSDWWMEHGLTNGAKAVLLRTTDNYGEVYSIGDNEYYEYSDADPESWFNSLDEAMTHLLTRDLTKGFHVTSTRTYNNVTKYTNSGGYLSGRNADTYSYLPSNIVNNINITAHELGNYKDLIYKYLFNGNQIKGTPSSKPLPTDGTKEIPSGNPSKDDNEKKKVYPYVLPSDYPRPDDNDDPSYRPTDSYDPDPAPNDDDRENPKKDPNSQPEDEPKDDPAPNPDPNKPSNDPTDDKPKDPDDPNPPDPDGGDPTPGIPILPIVASAGLGNIYNPSKAQVSALQSYLWSSNNLVDILKLFQNPVDGIISLHWVFGTPVDGGSKEITLGYLPTGVSAPVVTSQFTDIDCGTITIPLKQKNALDYPPYTDIQIYLPFIGIEPLNAYDLVGGTLNVTYRIDVYTGACVAKLTAKRNGLNCKLYEFAGNCGYELPLTSGNFVGMVGNVISGAVTGALIGGVGGAVLGGARSAIHSNMDVRRSGNLSANAGICGSRIPYVIITRAVPYDAANYNMFYGYPSNKTVYLSNCKGYTKVKDIILHTSATDEEKQEIESLLKEGVYL